MCHKRFYLWMDTVNQLAATDPAELGGKPRWVLADELHITRGEAGRRIAEAAELGPRRTLTGEPLAPVLPAVAAAQRARRIGAAHIEVIRKFFDSAKSTTTTTTPEPAAPTSTNSPCAAARITN